MRKGGRKRFRDAAGGTHRPAGLHRDDGVFPRDGGELEVYIAPVLSARGRNEARDADGSVTPWWRSGRGPTPWWRNEWRVSGKAKRLVPSNDELLLRDVVSAIDVAAVAELHELSDDASHPSFRSRVSTLLVSRV